MHTSNRFVDAGRSSAHFVPEGAGRGRCLDLGPGDAYDGELGVPLAGPTAPRPYALAEQFQSPANYFLDRVDLALTPVTSSPALRVEVYEDAAGAPGDLLATSQASPFVAGIVKADFNGATVLTGGANYWLGVFAEDLNRFTWHDSLSPSSQRQSVTADDGSTGSRSRPPLISGAAYRRPRHPGCSARRAVD